MNLQKEIDESINFIGGLIIFLGIFFVLGLWKLIEIIIYFIGKVWF